MDRDRDRDRRMRDIPPEDRYGFGGGQSYRPGNVRDRTPPRMDSYRARSPPRRAEFADTYRAPRGRTRSPLRRDDFRRRTPSPRGFRDREPRGGDSYRGRPRSPPPPLRREDLPRDDLFSRREPIRDDRRDFRDDRDRGYATLPPRSPPPRFRERSPLPLKRVREPSPISIRDRRTPPPSKRERLASPSRGGRYDDYPPSRPVSPPRRRFSPLPRDRRPSPPRSVVRDYRPRSRTPLTRNDRLDPRTVDDWRRPPRSPIAEPKQSYPARDESGQASGATSRRSSPPPIHPSRMALQQPATERASNVTPSRNTQEEKSIHRPSEPQPRRGDSYQDADNIPAEERKLSVGRERPPPIETVRQDEPPTTIPARAPPTGPGAHRTASASMAPPSGPAVSSSVPSGPRGSGPPPSGPRGAPPTRGDFASRGDFAPRGRGGFGGDFTSRGRGGFAGSFRGPRGAAAAPTPVFPRNENLSRSNGAAVDGFSSRGADNPGQEPIMGSRPPPVGPRGSFSQTPTAPAYRPSNNVSTTTYPRSQRFAPNGDPISDVPTGPKAGRRPTEPTISATPRVHPAIADFPKVIEGGKRSDPIFDRTKLLKLEEEAEKLRRVIEEKEVKKRKSLREWDRMTRETELAALRSELAEEALREQNGEAEAQAAF